MVQMQPEFRFTIRDTKLLLQITKLYINFFINTNDEQFVMELKYILENNYQEGHLLKMYLTKLINLQRTFLKIKIQNSQKNLNYQIRKTHKFMSYYQINPNFHSQLKMDQKVVQNQTQIQIKKNTDIKVKNIDINKKFKIYKLNKIYERLYSIIDHDRKALKEVQDYQRQENFNFLAFMINKNHFIQITIKEFLECSKNVIFLDQRQQVLKNKIKNRLNVKMSHDFHKFNSSEYSSPMIHKPKMVSTQFYSPKINSINIIEQKRFTKAKIQQNIINRNRKPTIIKNFTENIQNLFDKQNKKILKKN